MTWNIGEGRVWYPPDSCDGRDWGQANTQIGFIGGRIREQHPDLVLLNEALIFSPWPFGTGPPLQSGVNQVELLSAMTGLPYFSWGTATWGGAAWRKVNAVLARWPLDAPAVHPVQTHSNLSWLSSYMILQTSLVRDGRRHQIFSFRFDHSSPEAQAAGLARLGALASAVPSGESIIGGGDFNCGPGQQYFLDFEAQSGLRNTRNDAPDAQGCRCDNQIDHIFFRGPLQASSTEVRCPDPHPSDHPWVVADLQSTLPEPELVNVPAVVEFAPARARNMIQAAGLVYASKGPFGGSPGQTVWVGAQHPGPHAKVPRGTVITCTLKRGIKP